MSASKPDLSDLWIRHQRTNAKTTKSWACIFCPNRRVFGTEPDLWEHAKSDHVEQVEARTGDVDTFRQDYAAESAQKRTKDDRKPQINEANRAQPEPPPGKRSLEPMGRQPAGTRPALGIAALDINTPTDVYMKDASEEAAEESLPRKRPATGDGISAGSNSPFRDSSPPSSPRHSIARPASGQFDSTSDTDHHFQRNMFDTPGKPPTGKRQLWQEGQAGLSKASFNDPSNFATIAAQKARAQQGSTKNRKPFQPPPPSFQSPRSQVVPNIPPPSMSQPSQHTSILEDYEIVLQPETRPISQEQLVAEVKGIYAGLVMVEAKCIEVDNKQATLAQTDTGAQPKLNNEQWQALIALHRTLLHEHHDFFLASQHPSASAALRRLASKYAMPARMWRHGIHSFLELLRHRLPASLDHMLAFIYLAYSMMALLYETVPAFEDTWIECLGDLGRYRMAIEDDDIRDREVWTGVARHWYSKASDKAPTTGRLYHHLAILARPNALQQLFYYAKSLCVVIPFTSARESILTLFDPVLNADNHQGLYRLPPLDTSFVKAHGLLFTNKNMEKFEPTLREFLGLLDNQIGRVTRKFMEQGYHIAIANCVALLGFASKDNILMKAMASSDVEMSGSLSDHTPQALSSLRNSMRLTYDTLKIVLQRIGDPNVLPFIHVTLVFMHHMLRHPGAMGYLQAEFPWDLLATMLNTLHVSSGPTNWVEDESFPKAEKDDVRPFPEDFAMHGLLWTERYFPEEFLANEKIDEEEKYHELPSMTAERKERILWIGRRISNRGHGLDFNGKLFLAPGAVQIEPPERSLTYASATTAGETWSPSVEDIESDAEEDLPAGLAAKQSPHD
ncbi:hypothetical protein BGZ57DRAFT_133049 [Hyaloscypha finlandica]|nr:hypothetical protein BGZ57DRAFT_133049 [Hyaloscypha finlandica]